jgi:NTP pyrophosphatase (non-canonical NTP hydrolase)
MRMEDDVKRIDRRLKQLRDKRNKLDAKIPATTTEALEIADKIKGIDEKMQSIYKKFNKKYDEEVGRFD